MLRLPIGSLAKRYNRTGTRRAWGFFFISLMLYILCSAIWFIDIYIVWLELYRFLPGRISSDADSVPAFEASQALVGNIDYVREIFRETIVSAPPRHMQWTSDTDTCAVVHSV